MSAAVAWELAPAPVRSARRRSTAGAPGGACFRPSRSRLVLVPTGDSVAQGRRASLRITRMGRLVLTLAVVALLATVSVAALAGGGAASPGVDRATVVQPGQTLSEVAAQQLPQLPIDQAVVQIQLANDLSTAEVHAGQTLRIPELP